MTSSSKFDHPVGQDWENLQDCLQRSNALKAQGNDHFRSSEWHDAIAAYESALRELPKRPEQADAEPRNRTLSPGDNLSSDEPPSQSHEAGEERPQVTELPPPEVQECAKARSVLHANIGACYVKLSEHKKAVEACSQSLLDDPEYVKALQRRATSNEIIDSWSSLTAAQEDYTTLLKLLPPTSSQARDVRRLLGFLKPRLEASQKRETAEMLDKLKGLGNSILGNFGLSTDNFKFEPNGQGGYSMNFSR